MTARMGRMEKRLDGIDTRLDGIDSRLDTIDDRLDKKFDSIDRKFDAVDKRFNGIDNQLEKMSVMLVRHDHDIQEIKEKLTKLDTLEEMFGKFQNTLDTLVGYYKTNRQEVIMMEPRFKRLETRVDTLEMQFQT